MNIARETLRQLLREAYEQGWRGSLELSDSTVNSLLKKAESQASTTELDDIMANRHTLGYLSRYSDTVSWDEFVSILSQTRSQWGRRAR